jgi:hypothetical protein
VTGRLLWAALAALLLVAAVVAPRFLGGVEPEPGPPVADATARRSSPDPDPSTWRRGGDPPPVAPGVLARVAPRRPPAVAASASASASAPAQPPDDARCAPGTTGPGARAEGRDQEGAGVGSTCDKGGDGIEAIEIEWGAGAGDDP